MTDIPREPDHHAPLKAPRTPADSPHPGRDPARALQAAAPWVQTGICLVGLLLGVERIGALLGGRAPGPDGAGLHAVVGALAILIASGVAGLAAGRVLSALARFVDAQYRRAEAVARGVAWCEESLGPALVRLAERLEAPGVAAGAGAPQPGDPRSELAELRRAIAGREWALAEGLVRDFAANYPAHPAAGRLGGELAAGREAATQELMARLDAAREANDPDRVLEVRDQLTLLVAAEPLRGLDRDLGQWFLRVIQKRLRAGGMKPDIAHLAARVAAALDTTPEGASLRASLPTLRRSAGLCARCGEPYAGTADACPKCVTAAAAATPPPVGSWPEEAEEPDEDDFTANGRADDPFVRDDDD
jgi:hypothetical protein